MGARSARIVDHFVRCRQCGEEMYSPGQMDAALGKASGQIRRREGLLLPKEIRGIRQGLGLSQRAFEQLLGVGPKTVVRWERGTVFQNKATDSLLRVLRAHPETSRFLAEHHGVDVPDPAPADAPD